MQDSAFKMLLHLPAHVYVYTLYAVVLGL